MFFSYRPKSKTVQNYNKYLNCANKNAILLLNVGYYRYILLRYRRN